MIADVEEDRAIDALRALADNLYRPQMAFVERLERRLYPVQGYNLVQCCLLEFFDQPVQSGRVAHPFDHHHQLHRRFSQLHRRLRVLESSPIDNVGPVDQFIQPARVEAELFLYLLGDEFSAGTVSRIVKLPAAPVTQEMILVLPVEESALVMVEPPRQTRIAGVLEVYDGVFIAVEPHVDE